MRSLKSTVAAFPFSRPSEHDSTNPRSTESRNRTRRTNRQPEPKNASPVQSPPSSTTRAQGNLDDIAFQHSWRSRNRSSRFDDMPTLPTSPQVPSLNQNPSFWSSSNPATSAGALSHIGDDLIVKERNRGAASDAFQARVEKFEASAARLCALSVAVSAHADSIQTSHGTSREIGESLRKLTACTLASSPITNSSNRAVPYTPCIGISAALATPSASTPGSSGILLDVQEAVRASDAAQVRAAARLRVEVIDPLNALVDDIPKVRESIERRNTGRATAAKWERKLADTNQKINSDGNHRPHTSPSKSKMKKASEYDRRLREALMSYDMAHAEAVHRMESIEKNLSTFLAAPLLAFLDLQTEAFEEQAEVYESALASARAPAANAPNDTLAQVAVAAAAAAATPAENRRRSPRGVNGGGVFSNGSNNEAVAGDQIRSGKFSGPMVGHRTSGRAIEVWDDADFGDCATEQPAISDRNSATSPKAAYGEAGRPSRKASTNSNTRPDAHASSYPLSMSQNAVPSTVGEYRHSHSSPGDVRPTSGPTGRMRSRGSWGRKGDAPASSPHDRVSTASMLSVDAIELLRWTEGSSTGPCAGNDRAAPRATDLASTSRKRDTTFHQRNTSSIDTLEVDDVIAEHVSASRHSSERQVPPKIGKRDSRGTNASLTVSTSSSSAVVGTSFANTHLLQMTPSTTSMPVLLRMRALYRFDATESNELSLTCGTVVDVIERDASGWWAGRIKNRIGYFPSNYCTPLTDEEEVRYVERKAAKAASRRARASATQTGAY